MPLSAFGFIKDGTIASKSEAHALQARTLVTFKIVGIAVFETAQTDTNKCESRNPIWRPRWPQELPQNYSMM